MRKTLEEQAVGYQIARQKYVNDINTQRIKALSEGNAINYFKFCRELGISPEDEILYEKGQVESKGEELYVPSRGYSRREVSVETYRRFVNQTGRLRLKPFDVLSNIPEKRNLIKMILGNNRLYSKEGPRNIDNCEDSRIGWAFKKSYETACRALNIKY